MQITLYLKEEALDFVEPETLKSLVHKYSQFINFNIFQWASKTESVEEEVEEEEKVRMTIERLAMIISPHLLSE